MAPGDFLTFGDPSSTSHGTANLLSSTLFGSGAAHQRLHCAAPKLADPEALVACRRWRVDQTPLGLLPARPAHWQRTGRAVLAEQPDHQQQVRSSPSFLFSPG